LVGRKPKSYDYGHMIRVDLPFFSLTAMGPKVRMWFQKVYEEDYPKTKKELLERGYKKITAQQVDWTYLPRSCPKCCQPGGHPIFQRYKRTRSEHRLSIARNDQVRFKLYYNHSKPKYRQCFIGYLINGYIQISKKISPEKMNPQNWIADHKLERFELPKLKKLRKLS